MRNLRGGIPSRTYNRYSSKGDGRGASMIVRRKPHGADPLAIGAGKNDTAAQMEYLASKRRG